MSLYLPIPTQPDCISAWHEAVRLVEARRGHSAYNVIIDIANPTANTTRQHPGVAFVDDFLRSRGQQAVETVANTIFPASLYHLHRAPAFFDVFQKRVLGRVRRNELWSGYYFERMIDSPVPEGKNPNQLWDIVGRINDKKVKALNKFELPLFDAARDVNNSPYGGQCLSFLSFKVVPGPRRKRTLGLTAMYRNHFYVEKLLGNVVGLGRLMDFVCRETGLGLGELTIVSTRAEVDLPGRARRGDIRALLGQVRDAGLHCMA
jgi:hypothetical protein